MDIVSVFIYLLCFCVSLFFIGIGERQIRRRKNHRKLNRKTRLCLALGILFPCILAAFRDVTVGADVSLYIVPNINYAYSSNLGFLAYYRSMPEPTELLFAVLLYVCGKLNSLSLVFFIIELLCLLPFTAALVKLNRNNSITLGFALYFLLFYNFTLSGMRQGICMSLLLYAYTLLYEKRYKKTIIVSIIAFFIHSSSLVFIVVYFLCNFITNSKRAKMWTVVVLLTAGLSLVILPRISGILAKLAGVVSGRYAYYITKYLGGSSGLSISEIPATDMIVKTALVIIPWFVLRCKGKIKKEDNKFLLMVILGRYFVVFNGYFYESMRIAFYFDTFIVAFVPRIYNAFKRSFETRKAVAISISGLAFFYWAYFIMHIEAYHTAIYTFRF